MTDLATLKNVFRLQANFCKESGSPISALVLHSIAEAIGEGPPYGAFLQPWFAADMKTAFTDAVTMRILGAFRYLVLSGQAPALAALYAAAPDAIEPSIFNRALADAASQHENVIAGFMASPPQTNEVARSLALVGGFLTVAEETGLPLRCLELGASAGLNMNWDRFHYTFGDGTTWGDPGSSLYLDGVWTGPSPPKPNARVVERRGCDQNPVNVADPDQALRLQSYTWVGQTHRLERIAAAIEIKRATGGAPERCDAADWAEAHFNPEPGVATVVYHSVFLQYPPEPIRHRIVAAIEAAGARATTDAPVAWLSMEVDPNNLAGDMEVLLTLWPTGERRLLAYAHSHAAQVRWLA